MTKYDLWTIVQTEVNKGLSKVEAIRMLAFFLDEDDPKDPLAWYANKLFAAPF